MATTVTGRCGLVSVMLLALGTFLTHGTARGLPLGSLGVSAKAIDVPRQQSKEAYVTLLYGDEFLLGVRVLGQSIRETGSTKDMVVLVSSGVTDKGVALLKADGWIVELAEMMSNPNAKRPPRLWGVYTKLRIFNMTHIDDAFACREFCANLKHSERLNSGVLVVRPSRALFEDMLAKVAWMPSYTGGDQGFLNSYFADFPNAQLFVPGADASNAPLVGGGERLPTIFNADVGLYMLDNKWMLKEEEIRVMHFTLGPLKPWDWWTYFLLTPVAHWQKIKLRLPEAVEGTGGGRNPDLRIYLICLAALPALLLLAAHHKWLLQLSSTLNSKSLFSYSSIAPLNGASKGLPAPQAQFSAGQQGARGCCHLPSYLTPVSVALALCFALGAFGAAMWLVSPWTGLLLVYEWTFYLFTLLLSNYLGLLRHWGRVSNPSPPSSQGENRQYPAKVSRVKGGTIFGGALAISERLA
eukprot:jgi/Mesen1/3333/ME000191S02472